MSKVTFIAKLLLKIICFFPVYFFSVWWIVWYASSDILLDTDVMMEKEIPFIRLLKW